MGRRTTSRPVGKKGNHHPGNPHQEERVSKLRPLVQSPDSNEIVLAVRDAADWLGIQDASVRNAIKRGKLAAQVQQGRIVVKQSDLERYKC